MAIRVTRQSPEVLAQGVGEIRVTRHCVEVLGEIAPPGEKNVSAASTLSLSVSIDCRGCWMYYGANALSITQEVAYIGPKPVFANSYIPLTHFVYIPAIHEASAESTLSELEAASLAGGTRRIDAESTLALAGYGDTIVKARHEESTLYLMQSATVEKVLLASSEIVLSQAASSGVGDVWANSVIDLEQVVRLDPLPQYAESQLELSVDAEKNLYDFQVEQTLVLSQLANVTKPIRVSAESKLAYQELVYNEETFEFELVWFGLTQSATVNPQTFVDSTTYLSFSQIASPGHVKDGGDSVSGTSTLVVTHSAITNLTGDGESTLTLTQAATGQTGIPVESLIDLTQSAVFTIETTQPATTTLTLGHSAAYTLIIASTKSQYSPFVGSSTDPNAPDPPSTSIDGPMPGIQVPFQLVYPSTGTVTDAVSLSTPNLGNLDRLSFQSIQRETRGGTLIVYADPDWPKIETLVLSFSGLLNVEAQELLRFMEDHIGQEIGLIDWEHRFWRGIIVAPDEPIVEDRFDSFTASFSFEGELDPTWNPQVVPPTLRFSATRTPQEGGYYVCEEPTIPASCEGLSYSAEAGVSIKLGNPLYISAGLVYPAQADAPSTTQVVGVAFTDAIGGASCDYLTEGSITMADWTDIAGSVNLAAGSTYFLDPTTAGRITNIAPTTVGQYVVRIGRAVSNETLDLEIELPIRL